MCKGCFFFFTPLFHCQHSIHLFTTCYTGRPLRNSAALSRAVQVYKFSLMHYEDMLTSSSYYRLMQLVMDVDPISYYIPESVAKKL